MRTRPPRASRSPPIPRAGSTSGRIPGGSEMYFHPGFAARNAVTAVELAEPGAYASETILEGEAGLFAAFARAAAARARSSCSPTASLRFSPSTTSRCPPAISRRRPARRRCASRGAARRPIASRRADHRARAGRRDALSGLRLRRAVPARAAGQDEHPVRRGGGARSAVPSPKRTTGRLDDAGDPAPDRADRVWRRRRLYRRVSRPRRAPRSRVRLDDGAPIDGAAGRRHSGDAGRDPRRASGCGRRRPRAARAPPRSRLDRRAGDSDDAGRSAACAAGAAPARGALNGRRRTPPNRTRRQGTPRSPARDASWQRSLSDRDGAP